MRAAGNDLATILWADRAGLGIAMNQIPVDAAHPAAAIEMSQRIPKIETKHVLENRANVRG